MHQKTVSKQAFTKLKQVQSELSLLLINSYDSKHQIDDYFLLFYVDYSVHIAVFKKNCYWLHCA